MDINREYSTLKFVPEVKDKMVYDLEQNQFINMSEMSDQIQILAVSAYKHLFFFLHEIFVNESRYSPNVTLRQVFGVEPKLFGYDNRFGGNEIF